MVFSPVQFQSGQTAPASFEQDTEQQEGRMTYDRAQRKGLVETLQGIFNRSIKRLFYPNDVWHFSHYTYNFMELNASVYRFNDYLIEQYDFSINISSLETKGIWMF